MDKLSSARLTDKDRKAFVDRFNSSMKPRLFWMTNKGKPSIPFTGMPFAATSSYGKICCKTTSKKKRLEVVSSYKCEVEIYFRGIWHFPLPPFWGSKAGVWAGWIDVHMCVCILVWYNWYRN